LEGSGSDVFKTISRYLLGRAEENRKNTSVGIAGVPDKIRTGNIKNAGLLLNQLPRRWHFEKGHIRDVNPLKTEFIPNNIQKLSSYLIGNT
jgi:hypothetical protein